MHAIATSASSSAAAAPAALSTRHVRCLVVGEDLDFHAGGSFALAVDEDMSVDALKHQLLQQLPTRSDRERIVSELQLFKGFDLYVNDLAGSLAGSLSPTSPPPPPSHYKHYNTSPTKSTTAKPQRISTIDELLKTSTPDKIANRYFQRKYAMRTRRSLGEYLPRSRRSDSARIDVLVSVPKFVLSEDVAEMADDEDDGGDDYMDDSCASESESIATITPTKRKRDPVLDEAAASHSVSPSKWQRAPCGRVVSVSTLRMRRHCHRCLAFEN